jgi:hypothetical protein
MRGGGGVSYVLAHDDEYYAQQAAEIGRELADRGAGKASYTAGRAFSGGSKTVPHEGDSHTESSTITLTPMGDFLAEPDEGINYLVDGVIPSGGVALLAAKPKVGKTTTARDLALAVARGGRWLGYQCTAGTVWYFQLEGRRRDSREHFRRMGATAADPIRVFVGQAPRKRHLTGAETRTGRAPGTHRRRHHAAIPSRGKHGRLRGDDALV